MLWLLCLASMAWMRQVIQLDRCPLHSSVTFGTVLAFVVVVATTIAFLKEEEEV